MNSKSKRVKTYLGDRQFPEVWAEECDDGRFFVAWDGAPDVAFCDSLDECDQIFEAEQARFWNEDARTTFINDIDDALEIDDADGAAVLIDQAEIRFGEAAADELRTMFAGKI